eukprot:Awhi_evm1s4016
MCKVNPLTENPIENLRIGEFIGEGSFGKVFAGKLHGKDVAVKIFNREDKDCYLEETEVLQKLEHINIIRLLAAFQNKNQFY